MKFTIRYIKYTWISKQIQLICTCLYPIVSWCGCLCLHSFKNGSWWKQSRMGAKGKQITLWTQARKCKLLWSSKYWYIKEGLSSISSWPLFIFQKRLSYFNLCLLVCTSLTRTRDSHLIDRVTEEWSWKLFVDRWRICI